MGIQEAEYSRAHHATLERFYIQRTSIHAADFSRAHHAVLERVRIQHLLIYRCLITTYYFTFTV